MVTWKTWYSHHFVPEYLSKNVLMVCHFLLPIFTILIPWHLRLCANTGSMHVSDYILSLLCVNMFVLFLGLNKLE